MSANEMQHWLDRNRPPRVQITYDVETLGSSVKQSIPFIVGVIGDFAGGDRTADSPIAERGFVEIDRDNFPQVMKTLAPALTLDSQPRFQVSRTPDGSIYGPDAAADPFPVSLSFTGMEDFAPPAIIEHVPQLKEQMQTRLDLRDLLAKLGTAPALDKQLKAMAAAAAPALDKARAAHKAVTPLPDAQAEFDAAATAVLAAETDGARKAAVTRAQTVATSAVSGFRADASAAADDADAKKVSDDATAVWTVAAALRDGMQTLRRTVAGYDKDSGTPEQKTALQQLEAAGAVDEFVALAGTAAVLGANAVALNPTATPTAAPTPPPAPNP
jgi:type VI secretion system protein ImpB